MRRCPVENLWSRNAASRKLQNFDDLILADVEPLRDLIDRRAGFEVLEHGRDRQTACRETPRHHSSAPVRFPRRSIPTNQDSPCSALLLKINPARKCTPNPLLGLPYCTCDGVARKSRAALSCSARSQSRRKDSGPVSALRVSIADAPSRRRRAAFLRGSAPRARKHKTSHRSLRSGAPAP